MSKPRGNTKPRYVPIEDRVLEQFLQEKGFRRTVQDGEIVYVREHKHCHGLRVKVYTSIITGTPDGRDLDAIRVSCAYEGPKPLSPYGSDPQGAPKKPSSNFGVYKAKRTYRTGSEEKILDRLYLRMREAYQAGTEFVRERWKEITS